MKKQSIVILGSTGSIGRNTLDVIRRFPNRFRVCGLSAGSNISLLMKQIDTFKPHYVAVYDKKTATILRHKRTSVKIFDGIEGICKLVSFKEVDTVVMAIAGSVALLPVLEAIRHEKKIALANKESLVIGGHIVKRQLKRYPRAAIIPIDSEQNAIFQCFQGHDPALVRTLYLTASGGPLFNFSKQQLKRVTPEIALSHPRWKMGKKISIDSATLMNKGLEVIEAKWLFDMSVEAIKVVVHRQAIIHSLVEFIDGSLLGQLSVTDMRLPIQYALSFPHRWHNNGALRLDLVRLGTLSFEQPDVVRFPCLQLAYQAARSYTLAPCVLNAANEVAVDAFLSHRMSFSGIAQIVKRALQKFEDMPDRNRLHDVLDCERSVRQWTQTIINK